MKKILISTVLWFLSMVTNLLSLKTDVIVPTERNKQKTLWNAIIGGFLNATLSSLGRGSEDFFIISVFKEASRNLIFNFLHKKVANITIFDR
jgi:hypothetical protein